VAVVGSVFTSLYAKSLAHSGYAQLPHDLSQSAKQSVAAAYALARQAPASGLLDDVDASFMTGLHVACVIAAGVCLLGALGALALPGRRPIAAVAAAAPAGAVG
jgi:hypothetical protein